MQSLQHDSDELRRVFGGFEGDRDNLPPFDNIYPGNPAPVLRRDSGGLKLEMMTWGFPGPQAAGGRPVTNVRIGYSSALTSSLPAGSGASRAAAP